jgi:hypothetical protein
MSARAYLESKVNELVVKFPEVRVRYDYHLLSSTHTLEIVPNELYNFNEAYKIWEEDLLFEFIDLFPDESISIVTDDSLLGLEKFEVEFVGASYNKVPTTAISCDSLFYQTTNFETFDFFKKYLPQFSNAIPLSVSAHQRVSIDSLKNLTFDLHINTSRSKTTPVDPIPSEQIETRYSEPGENTYALAA